MYVNWLCFLHPLENKLANEVLQAYIDNVYAKFGGSLKILSDNGTELKNQLFEKVAKELGVKHKIYTAPYRPSPMVILKAFIISSKPVYLNMFHQNLTGLASSS